MPRCVCVVCSSATNACVVCSSATNAVARFRHRTDYCAFLIERREPHGVPSPCGHSCVVCAIVCLTVVPSFSDTTDVLTIGHSSKTDRSRTPLFHVAQYGDDIIGRELNLRKLPGRQWESNPQSSEQLRPITIKTSASTETASWM